MKKMMFFSILLMALICLLYPGCIQARDLVAGVGHIPPHAVVGEDGRPAGGFVDVVKAIDDMYTQGAITISVFPIKRALSNLTNNRVDFMIPYIPNPLVPEENLPFTFATEAIVDVVFVLYTRIDGELSSMDHLEKFHIETLRGAEPHFPFKISGIDSFRQGIMRVSLGRSDGFIGEQDGCDLVIRQLKLNNIRREQYAKWESSIVIRKGPEGEEIDRILSNALRILKQTGRLQKITDTIHRPFEDWQPYLTDWSQTK